MEYYELDAVECECYVRGPQIICTNWESIKFGEYMDDVGAYTIVGQSRYCVNGYFSIERDWVYRNVGDLLEDDFHEYGMLSTEDITFNTGLGCVSGVSARRLAQSGHQCPAGVKLYKQDYRQAISSIEQGYADHIHSHGTHSLTFSDCPSSFVGTSPVQFSRHVGYGSGQALGYRFNCADSFGAEDPLIRLQS